MLNVNRLRSIVLEFLEFFSTTQRKCNDRETRSFYMNTFCMLDDDVDCETRARYFSVNFGKFAEKSSGM